MLERIRLTEDGAGRQRVADAARHPGAGVRVPAGQSFRAGLGDRAVPRPAGRGGADRQRSQPPGRSGVHRQPDRARDRHQPAHAGSDRGAVRRAAPGSTPGAAITGGALPIPQFSGTSVWMPSTDSTDQPTTPVGSMICHQFRPSAAIGPWTMLTI